MLHFLRRLDLLLGGCRVKMGLQLGTLSRGTLSLSVGAPPLPGSLEVETSRTVWV